MSTPPDRPLDALGLARSGTLVERGYPISGFTRLRDRLANSTGRALARAEFHLAGRWPAARLTVSAEVTLTCQRCLGAARRTLELTARLVFAAEDAPELPDGYEAIGGDPRKLALAALVEDELLLSLPLIPHHAAGEACALPGDGGAAAPDDGARAMRRQFAGLKDLLKH